MRIVISILLSVLPFFWATYAQVPSPETPFIGRLLIQYATIHVGDGNVIQNGLVEVQNGEISRVADAGKSRVNLADYDSVINADGAELYPGFILMDSRLGLTEIGAVRATHDYNETGDFLPNVRTLPAFNTASKIIPTVRTNGVLMAQIAPIGGRISGKTAVVHFDGWSWEDAAIRADEGVYLNWPDRYRHTGWWGEPGSVKPNKKYDDEVESIYSFFQSAEAYVQTDFNPEQNLRFEAMREVFSGKARVYIRANAAKDILDVIQFIRSLGLSQVALVGGAEAHLVSIPLLENNIPVVIDRVHKLPKQIDAHVHEAYALAGILRKAGLEVAFSTSGDMEAMISRNLPFQVGTAVHHGMEYEDAIQSLSLTPAKLLGIDSLYGSIEPGKRASLFLSEGDALDIPTNKLRFAMIEGCFIDLNNHQRVLYEKYARKQGVEIVD